MSSPPEDANEHCVGPSSEGAGKSESCSGCPNQGACASGAGKQEPEIDAQVLAAMSKVKHRVLVLSGKGGVGKSTFSAQLAFGLAQRGLRVGLLDVDVCGPSIPLMMGLKGREVHQSASGWSPVYVDVPSCVVEGVVMEGELGVMSIGFLMPDPDAAVIWRGPRKTGLLTQFFGAVDWGELDFLVIDTPPGTSDEHISIVQLLKPTLGVTDGALVVTTPQEVAMTDVRKELNFCKQTGIRVLGVVENMAPITVPLGELQFRGPAGNDVTEATLKLLKEKCPEIYDQVSACVDVFPSAHGGPEAMAKRFGVDFMGRVPLDKELQKACDEGNPGAISTSSSAKMAFKHIVENVVSKTHPGLFEEKLKAAKERAAKNGGKSRGGVVSVKSGAVVAA